MTNRSEFTPYKWHDNPIYALRLEIGDPDAGDWRSNLVLDIDHIMSWPRTLGGDFQVAPATLSFHHAADLHVAIDCGDTGGQVALHELSIDGITREQVENQKVCLDRPYYRWRIELNWPAGGTIRFSASGYTQVLRSRPVFSARPRLPASCRSASPEHEP